MYKVPKKMNVAVIINTTRRTIFIVLNTISFIMV